MSKSLPDRPSLEHLKKQAKELLQQLRAGDSQALQRARAQGESKTSGVDRAGKWSLTQAQRLLAREYGFPNWATLKERVEAVQTTRDPQAALHAAFAADKAEEVEKLLAVYPELRARINDPVGAFDAPAILHVKSARMLEVLIAAGADINAKSRWWAGGFGVLHYAKPELAAHALKRGAEVDVHAAARLGLLDELRRLLSRQPSLVDSRGGDGQTPLHFAGTIEVAKLLLEHGADIDARDIDHESTPAQYMVKDRQPVLRFLVHQGCQTDILLAAALGNQSLAERHLRENPNCIRMRVSDEWFPKTNHHSGGTIYQWTLGWHVSASQVADEFGHRDMADWLMEQAPAEFQLTDACWRGQKQRVLKLLNTEPTLPSRLLPEDRRQVAHAARNNNLPAVKLFLQAQFPVDARGQHGATPLHWAAWHGNVDMVTALLRQHPPLEAKDADFQGTPVGWAIHGSENGWYKAQGDYGQALKKLLEAGASPPDKISGTPTVQSVLREWFGQDKRD